MSALAPAFAPAAAAAAAVAAAVVDTKGEEHEESEKRMVPCKPETAPYTTTPAPSKSAPRRSDLQKKKLG